MLADDRHGKYGGDTFIRGSKYFKGLELGKDVFGGFFVLAGQVVCSLAVQEDEVSQRRGLGSKVVVAAEVEPFEAEGGEVGEEANGVSGGVLEGG